MQPATSPQNSPPQPSATRRLAHVSLILLLLINLFNYIDRYILAAVQETIGTEFHASKAAMGWLVTGFLVTYMLLSPLFGWLGDRGSRWLIIGVGVLLWTVASGASGLAGNYGTLLATRCLIGVGEAAYGPVAPTLIADLYPVQSRGKIMAWFYAAIPVGSAAGYMLGGPFAHPGKWHHAFLLTIPPGILLGVWCLFMREPRRGDAEPPTEPRPKHTATMADYLGLLRIRSYVLNTAAMTAMTFAIGGVAFWMPVYLTGERGFSPEKANLFFGGITVVAGLGATLLGGWAGDALRSRVPGSYFLVSGLGMLVGFPLFLLLLVTPFPLGWGVLFAAIFCLFFNTGPSNTALANCTPPAVRATAFALNILCIHLLGDAISPGIIGAIADRSSLKIGFIFVSITMALGGVLWLMGMKTLAADTLAVERGELAVIT